VVFFTEIKLRYLCRMAEPLKNLFSRPLVEGFAQTMQTAWPPFDGAAFAAAVFGTGWEQLELKQRMRRIAECLGAALPNDYPAALEIVMHATEHLIRQHGEKLTFEYCFLPDFVEVFGQEYPDASIPALETITRWSSAEFAVRPFLLRYPERMYPQMLAWSKHSSPMVRRLSSEGFRPRLPWGMGVPVLKRDPAPILPVLENLKADPAETVRRSVANCLNDISKDHPALALDIAGRWHRQHPDTDWIVRHALRGLLKKGHEEALARFGFDQNVAGITVENLDVQPTVPVGGELSFSFAVKNTGANPQPIRLEYGIDYLTGSGKVSPKIFKIKEMILGAGQTETIQRRQRFTDFTTRKHYAGGHRLRVLVNGMEMTGTGFEVSGWKVSGC
jgi:3-methyladenine DNA glycosylase AlkC